MKKIFVILIGLIVAQAPAMGATCDDQGYIDGYVTARGAPNGGSAFAGDEITDATVTATYSNGTSETATTNNHGYYTIAKPVNNITNLKITAPGCNDDEISTINTSDNCRYTAALDYPGRVAHGTIVSATDQTNVAWAGISVQQKPYLFTNTDNTTNKFTLYNVLDTDIINVKLGDKCTATASAKDCLTPSGCEIKINTTGCYDDAHHVPSAKDLQRTQCPNSDTFAHARSFKRPGTYRTDPQTECKINKCEPGYKLINNTCVAKDANDPTPDTVAAGETQNNQNTSTGVAGATASGGASGTQSVANADANNNNGAGKLSRDDTKKELDELNENLDNQKQKEQSLANRTLAAAGMGATGIGLSQALSAKAEQDADDDAERAMRAYLETFKCTWGSSGRARGGETNIAVGDGNDTTALYSQYMQLADSLKMRKESLNITPGIESEVIIDTATTGLYDDVGDTRGTGAFASLSRALMDPNGADAEMWASQKSKTSEKLKTGTTIAAVGAIGSLAGNLALNTGKRASALRERSDEITAEYAKKRQFFADVQSELDKVKPSQTCADYKMLGIFPNCTCPDGQYFNNDGVCVDNDSDGTATRCKSQIEKLDAGKCKCLLADDDPLRDSPNCACIENAVVMPSNGIIKCGCEPGYAYDQNRKECYESPAVIGRLQFGEDNFFERGKATLQNEDQITSAIAAKITEYNNQHNATYSELNDFNPKQIIIRGYSDKSGFSSCKHSRTRKSGENERQCNDRKNQELSEKRAEALGKYLVTKQSISQSIIKTVGLGSQGCETDNRNGIEKKCRKVEMVFFDTDNTTEVDKWDEWFNTKNEGIFNLADDKAVSSVATNPTQHNNPRIV